MSRFFGLTGGIGSGKSTVALMFGELGVPLLDLDHVGKLVMQDNPCLLEKLVAAFGSAILDAHGHLNRQQLAHIAFQTAQQTQQLNQLLHPLIQAYEQRWRAQQTACFAIIEASVLIESNGVQRMDGLIVVSADEHQRKERVLKRGKQSASVFAQIIQRQCDDVMRQQWADYTITNQTSLVELKCAVKLLFEQLMQGYTA